MPARYDLSLPGNQRKLEAVEQLAQLAEEAGISLIHLALAFVIRHPGVTSAIVGPRTLEQLEGQLGAVDVAPERRRARPDRRDRPAGHEPERRGRRLAPAAPGRPRRAPPLDGR